MRTSVLEFGMKHGNSPVWPVRFLAGCCRNWERWKADRIEKEFQKDSSVGISPEEAEEIRKRILED